MSKRGGWEATNLRLGNNPIELAQMAKEGKLTPHLNVKKWEKLVFFIF